MASDEIAVLLKQAALAQRAGDKVTAIACLQEVVARHPRHEAAWIWLGGLLADPQQAVICLQNALAINPDSAPAQQGLAWWQGRLATESAERQAARTHLMRAEQVGQAGQSLAAIEEYRLAVALDPHLLDAWFALGMVCQQLGWTDEAALAYRQTLVLDPKHSLAQQALHTLQVPFSRAGTVLWSTSLAESEAGNFCASSNGQFVLVASGGVGTLAPGELAGRPSGRIHLVDRYGDAQSLTTDWRIWQAGLSADSSLVYATQAARHDALVAWIEPTDVTTPLVQYRLQGGPPTVWKCPNDLLVAASPIDSLTAIDLDGNVVWQAPHEQCDSIKIQPSANGQAALVITETLQAFTSSVQIHLLTAQGQTLWSRLCPHWLSATILDVGLRVLLASAKTIEAINQQGVTTWKKSYKDVTFTYLDPTQRTVIVQYEHASALEALDTWGGRALWQRTNLSVNGVEFASLDQAAVLVLRDKTLLEALDIHRGNTLWQIDLGQYARETGRLVHTGEDWVAVLLGQTLVTIDKNGRVVGVVRFTTSDVAVRALPRPARGVMVTEAGRRMMLLDRLARPVWAQAIPCRDWLLIPHSPYLVALGPKTSDHHTLTMLRWE